MYCTFTVSYRPAEIRKCSGLTFVIAGFVCSEILIVLLYSKTPPDTLLTYLSFSQGNIVWKYAVHCHTFTFKREKRMQ